MWTKTTTGTGWKTATEMERDGADGGGGDDDGVNGIGADSGGGGGSSVDLNGICVC